MLETPQQALVILVILGVAGIILGGLGAVINSRKNFMSKQVLYYIYIPLMVLPGSIVATYIFLPKGSVNFAVRLLVAIGILILAFLPVFPTLALIERMYLKFGIYPVQEDEESNG